MPVPVKAPKGYRAGTVAVERWRDGVVVRDELPGYVCEAAPHLAFHQPLWEEATCYTVTHVPTGRAICNARTQAVAKQAIGLLAGVENLGMSSPTGSVLAESLVILSSLQSRLNEEATASPRRKSAKQRAAAPLSFSPVWTAFVPTTETRAAGHLAAAALGEAFAGRKHPQEAREACERAAAVQWREEIMVRVTQKPTAILLEADIPTSPPTSGTPSPQDTSKRSSGGGSTGQPCLLDGMPATPAEFKRRYNLLLELGDRLRAGSLRFQTLHREGEREGWTTARLERWERLDERFRSIVGEAWMIWSGAAFCLAVNPALRANVEARLGYVGSVERGWHELGIKTFLRHPEIAECLPIRREMKEKIWNEL